MPSSGSWNNTTYSIPLAGELNWSVLSNFLIDLRNNAQTTNSQKIGARVATSTPVTVSAITDAVIGINIGSASAVNLPAGVTGQVFTIVDTSGAAATNNITIDANAAETINGSATYVINRNNAGVTLAWTGTEWNIVQEVVTQGSTTGTGNLVFSVSPTFTGTLSSNTHNILGTTATQLLSVSDGTNSLHVLPGDAGGGYTPGVIIETTNNVPLHFGTNSSASQAQLTTAGNFGVATVTPTERLHITGNSLVTGMSTVGGNIIGGDSVRTAFRTSKSGVAGGGGASFFLATTRAYLGTDIAQGVCQVVVSLRDNSGGRGGRVGVFAIYFDGNDTPVFATDAVCMPPVSGEPYRGVGRTGDCDCADDFTCWEHRGGHVLRDRK